MSVTTELTIYVIAIMLVVGMAFITHAMISMNKRLNDRISEVRRQFMILLASSSSSQKQKVKIDQHLEGDVELTHPRSGEKIKARAKFRLKK